MSNAYFHPSNVEKRRSERVTHSVPVVVRGVDLLGQPFEERTSALVLSLHGCKYSSKHHVPKNSWITLEPSAVEKAARVRARVVGIQRPPTPREYFQIAAEFEFPSNIWGVPAREDRMNSMEMSDDRDVQTIADHGDVSGAREEATVGPAADNGSPAPAFEHAPDGETPSYVVDASANDIARQEESGTAASDGTSKWNSATEASEESSEVAADPQDGDLAAIEIPPALAGFMEKLLAASRKTAVESEAQTTPLGVVGKMESPLVRELRAQVEQHATRAVEDAAAKANAEIQRNSEKLVEQQSAGAEEFYQRWKDEYERDRTTVREQLSAEMEERLAARSDAHSDFEAEFRGDITRGRELMQELERRTELLRSELSSAETTTSHLAQLRLQVETLNARVEEQMTGRPGEESRSADDEAAMIDWRRRLKRESDTARGQWMELLDSSLDSAMQRLAARLADETQNALNAGDRQIEARAAELSGPALAKLAEAREALTHVESLLETQVSGARASLAELEQAATRLKESSEQWESHGKATVERLERRLEKILNNQTAELNHRAETLAAGLVQRVTPTLETAGHSFITQTLAEVQARLAPHIERLPELLRELSAREVQAEESLRLHRERLRQSAESIQREAESQREATLADLREKFEAIRAETLGRWVEELDTSGVRATHSTAEAMGKSSDWYVHQTQGRIQSLVEENVTGAEALLQRRAEEAAQQAVTVLEQRRAEHSVALRAQIEEVATAAVERSRYEIEEAAHSVAASFGQVLSSVSDEQLEKFHDSARGAREQASTQLEESKQQFRAHVDAQANETLDRFREHLAAGVHQTTQELQGTLQSQVSDTLDLFRKHRESLQEELRLSFDRLSSESIGMHAARLETASDSWMLRSVRQLNEHGRSVMDSLAKSSELAVRNSFQMIFEGMARTLRESAETASSAAAGAGAGAGQAAPPDQSSSETEKHVSN